jgi:predicted CXXCH cytochrome family protein
MRIARTAWLRAVLLAAVAGGAGLAAQAGRPSDVVGSKHDLSVTGGASSRAVSETEPCVFCHAPHNASPAPQLWNHQTGTATSYTTYGSSSFDSGTVPGTFNTFPGRRAGQPAGSAKLCLSCHDGTIALGATLNNGTIAMGGGSFVPATANVGTDLSNDHPVSFRRSSTAGMVVDPPPGDPVRVEAGTGYVQCVSCHDPHTESVDPTTRKFLVKPNRGSAICTSCHDLAGTGWSWASSPHATSNATFTAATTGGVAGLGAHTGYGTVAENACESCHRPHTAPQAERLLKAVNQRDLCFQCHGSTSVARKNLVTAFAKASRHPLETSSTTILHDVAEVQSSGGNFAGARRHVDCTDCHSPHAASGGLHTPGTNLIGPGGVLAGVAGVEPSAWPGAVPETGSFPMPAPASGGYMATAASSREYQVCFKCHTGYAFGSTPPSAPSGGIETDVAAEFNPNNRSYHPVVGAPRLRTSASNLLAPWNTTTAATRMYCSDCHGSDETTSVTVAAGPHGSNNPYLLRFANATWSPTSPTLSSTTGLCFNCHPASTIRLLNRVHGVGEHRSRACQACHAAVPHGSFRVGLIAQTTDPAPYNQGAARIVRFTAAATPSGYQKSNCSTASGCH